MSKGIQAKTKLLRQVEESIEICENYRGTKPDYYIDHWQDKHILLLALKKTLTGGKPPCNT